MFNSPRNL
jgi:hypothetical protein